MVFVGVRLPDAHAGHSAAQPGGARLSSAVRGEGWAGRGKGWMVARMVVSPVRLRRRARTAQPGSARPGRARLCWVRHSKALHG